MATERDPTLPEATAPAPAQRPQARAAPVATTLSLLWPLLWVLLAVVVVLGGAGAGLRWLLFTEPGAQWALRQVPGLQVQGLRGALLGDRLQAQSLQWQDASGLQVQVQALDIASLQWQWFPQRGVWVALDVQRLSAEAVRVRTGPPSGQPAQPPAALKFPLRLTLAELALDTVTLDEQPPLQALRLRGLALDGTAEGVHRVEDLSLQWRDLALQAQGQVGAAAPLPLTLSVTARPVPDSTSTLPAWTASAEAKGTLQQLDLSATLRGEPARGTRNAAPPSLDAQARVAPFAAWPVTALDLQAAAIDLRALQRGAPQTRLGGQVQVRAAARDAPVDVSVQLANTLPGRWNEGRLPLRQAQLQARGSLEQPDLLEVSSFRLDLGDAPGARGGASVISGSARWQGTQLALEALLDELAPQHLDGRAPLMRLTGPLTLRLDGVLPSPDPQAAAPTPRPDPSAVLTLSLLGQVDGAPVPVQLELAAEGGPRRVQISRLQATAGPARAELEATLQRQPRGDWTLQTKGALREFDPVPWWPGAPGSAWRQGPHRLSASWMADLRLPGDARRLEPLALLPRLQGNGQLQVTDSRLAGVPVSGELVLGYTPASRSRAGSLHGELDVGGNRLVLDVQGDPNGPGPQDELLLQISAERLATLAPLTALHPQAAAWAPRGGSARGSLSATGRWPAARTEGTLQLSSLQAGRLTLDHGLAAWRLDSRGEAPLTLETTLENLRLDGQTLSLGRASLRGNAARHRIEFEAAAPVAPPAIAGQVLGVQPRRGTQAVLRADGGWQRDPAGGGRWTARIERLGLQPWDGEALDAAAPDHVPRWTELRDLSLVLDVDGDGGLRTLDADPGELQLAAIGRLRWERVQVDLRPARPQLDLRATLDPVRVAPLMARLQPGMGWAGDLRVSAKLDLRASETFSADVTLRRHDGDLHIVGQAGLQLLGLEDMLLTLTARDGAWEAVQTFRGRSLGEINGRQRVRTTPDRRWPEPEALVQGSLEVRVADIGIWNNWVPPGWRLGGEMLTRARLSGPVGKPSITGRVTAQGVAARNLLEGVNVTDGVVDIALEGDRARIETFTLRGGDGQITLTGGATLGRSPVADLVLKAERFRVLGRVDRQVVASGDTRLRLGDEFIALDGRLRVDQGLFDASRGDAPSLDSDVTVRRAGEPAPVAVETEPGPRRDIRMALDVDLGQDLVVRGRGLDTALRGQLRVSMPGGRLALTGTVNTERGTYAAYGQKLEIERGLIAFAGPPDNPRLDVLALRANTDIRVGVAITGNLQTLRVRLYSDPELSENEKLAWLVLGREPDGLGRTDTALLQRAAVALLSGEGEGATDTVLRGLGIDDFSLRQADGDSRETVVTLGKQLGRRWYLGYERGVNAAAGTWQLIYRVAQRITVRAQSGLENSLDIIWNWRVGELPPGEAGRTQEVIAVPPRAAPPAGRPSPAAQPEGVPQPASGS
jgi:translocation and assembly module TamB